MFTSRFFVGVSLGLMLLSTMGCGGNDCGVTGLSVGPATATVDHAAATPANSQVFVATDHFGGGNGVCTANAAALVNSNWTVSDPSVHLSATQGFQVTATCTAAIANPVTITATTLGSPMSTGKASLTCN
jgi:hypothetical protein